MSSRGLQANPRLPVMREREVREAADCGICGRPFGENGLPLFWRVRATRYGFDREAVARQDGFAAMLGSSALAAVMGPDPVMATAISDVEITVCETCAGRATVYEVGLRESDDDGEGGS